LSFLIHVILLFFVVLAIISSSKQNVTDTKKFSTDDKR